MLAFLAAVLAAATQSLAPDPLAPETPTVEAPAVDETAVEESILEAGVAWWEKITVTVDDKGKQRSCRFETSLSPSGAEACDEDMASTVRAAGGGPTGQFSKVTFERRFSPGAAQVDGGNLQPGDTLLGRQVMFLTIDAKGMIETCHVVAFTGEARPAYDCDEAKKEQFRVPASEDAGARQAFMTILAYGHSEHIA